MEARQSCGKVLQYICYMHMCHCEGCGFQAVYSGVGRSEIFDPEEGVILEENDKWVE